MKQLSIAILCASFAWSVSADTIFDNSVTDLNTRFNPGTYEVGDEIVLAGDARYLTNFSFEYWGTNTAAAGNPLFSGVVQARVRFYKNDGLPFNGYPTPGTCFWASSWFSVFPTARNVLVFEPGLDFPTSGIYLPSSDMTWTVQFQGMSATDIAGIDFYSPAVVGADYPDYWQRGSETNVWTLMTNSLSTDFAATMQATLIPSPAIPSLTIMREAGNQKVVTWPGWATNYVLETSTTFSSWTSIPTGITWSDNNFVYTNTSILPYGFFRLQLP
jgi:hypothetical protein